MAYLHELGKIYWHASFYCDFFDLAASINNDLPTQSRTETQDPLISFLQEQTGLNKKIIPKLVNNIANRAQDGGEVLSHHTAHDTSSTIHGLQSSENESLGSITSLPIMLGIQEQSGNQPMVVDIINNMADRDGLFYDETGADIVDVPKYDNLQFEEWLGIYGTFQNIFPSA
jgi:hypothetical protein